MLTRRQAKRKIAGAYKALDLLLDVLPEKAVYPVSILL
jgi:hypothetical protein